MERKKSPKKDYRKQSPQYFLIGLVVALSTTLLAFEYRTVNESNLIICPGEVGLIDPPDIMPPITLPKPPTKTPPPEPAPPAPVPDPEPWLEPEPTPDPDPGPNTEPDTAMWEPEPLEVDDLPKNYAEIMPEFVGGEAQLYKYLGENVKYPPLASENNLEAKLYVQFIVNKDGSVSDAKVMNPKCCGFNKEAIRVINNMPKWKPGKQAGKNVRVYYVIPINFALL